jgi:hypothetical protein
MPDAFASIRRWLSSRFQLMLSAFSFRRSHELAFFAISSDADISEVATTPLRDADTRLFSPPYCHATLADIAAFDISPLFSLRQLHYFR